MFFVRDVDRSYCRMDTDSEKRLATKSAKVCGFRLHQNYRGQVGSYLPRANRRTHVYIGLFEFLGPSWQFRFGLGN